MQPKISVLIPTYNYGQFISQAIDSVLAQDYDNLEIIVIDDGSTDNTEEIVGRLVGTLRATSLRYFYKEHSGISASRNLALEKATGEFIAWIDADDIWLPGKLVAQIEYFRQNPDYLIVFTRFANFFHNEELQTNPLSIQKENLKTTKYYLASSLAKKTLYDQCGSFKTELVINEDVDWLFRLKLLFSDIGANKVIDTIYYMRRLHGNNITLKEQPLVGHTFVNKLLLPNMKQKIRESMKKS